MNLYNMIYMARFLFFHTLNDFLSDAQKNKWVSYEFKGTPAIKDAAEAIGIPHTEVDVIIVNGSPADFSYRLQHDDAIEVYPANAASVFLQSHSLTPGYTYPLSFIADVQLGKLAKALRIFGFDTIYENNLPDKMVAGIAEKDQRIVLTRDKGLLKHKSVKWGYWLRSQMVEEQLEEVISRFKLLPEVAPFKRCLACNGKIEEVAKETVLERLPSNTILYFRQFFQCSLCQKVYWKGSHYKNMLELVERNLNKQKNKK